MAKKQLSVAIFSVVKFSVHCGISVLKFSVLRRIYFTVVLSNNNTKILTNQFNNQVMVKASDVIQNLRFFKLQ